MKTSSENSWKYHRGNIQQETVFVMYEKYPAMERCIEYVSEPYFPYKVQ